MRSNTGATEGMARSKFSFGNAVIRCGVGVRKVMAGAVLDNSGLDGDNSRVCEGVYIMKTKASAVTIVYCQACEDELTFCNGHKRDRPCDYSFEEGDTVWCISDGHFCEECYQKLPQTQFGKMLVDMSESKKDVLV